MCKSGARETVCALEHLLGKCEDLSSNPRTHLKDDMSQMCDPITPAGEIDGRDYPFLGTCGPGRLALTADKQQRPV